MARPYSSLLPTSHTLDVDGCAETGRVHLCNRRQKDQTDTSRLKQAKVAWEIARIACKVLVGTELGRVDKDRRRDSCILGAGSLDQSQMSRVEIAHRRHEPERTERPARCQERADALDNLHHHLILGGY